MWSWAIQNAHSDHKEFGELLFSFTETLCWLLQPEAMQKSKNQVHMPEAKDFLVELEKHGASKEYVEKEKTELNPNQMPEGDISIMKAPSWFIEKIKK